MKTFKQLQEQFDRDVKELRTSCKHEDVSDWIEEQWAPGHSSGREVQVCNICNKVVGARGGVPIIYEI